ADYFKAEAEGVNAMCELMEKFGEKKLEEGRAEGRLEGRLEGHREMLDMARSLLKLNVPLEVIEKSSGLTRAEILAL
ncbi:MAG: nuclease, partial [Selenomonas sp.]|nr:nuclease [Selenomonas sp.]